MDHFPAWIGDLPEVDAPFNGLEGRLLSGPRGQTVFFVATKDLDVTPHSHGAQYGIVLAGRVELRKGGEERVLGPGETYEIAAGEEHAARVAAGTALVEVFQEPDRYAPK
ncbi:cupin domain-containing protein [Rubrobacter marinus]|uniref:Cupin domain-containing protein n=1 Tax=Rubrobacter marinus TaxID=2653852 RepID=A0A6G8PWH9_9ACTN|nr:cupin domain-containing protein [Rubrobacter marinus]QIN78568.1 cupin domain-containing protein [Rubrobacter marinus]